MTTQSIKLEALTNPIVDGIHTPEEFLAYTARVSNPSNQLNTETSSKLLQYCIKNKHWSIFEHVFLTYEFNTTRDIGRQILRHRSYFFQEYSARYAKPTDLGFIHREARLQDVKNRQSSVETNDEKLQRQWKRKQDLVIWICEKVYSWAIENGIAKEQARAVLPEGLTLTRMYISGNLRSYIHWIDLRTSKETQKEHRELAEMVKSDLITRFEFLKDYWTEKEKIEIESKKSWWDKFNEWLYR